MIRKFYNDLQEEEFVIQFVSETRDQAPDLVGKKLWYMYRIDLNVRMPIVSRLSDELSVKHDFKKVTESCTIQ